MNLRFNIVLIICIMMICLGSGVVLAVTQNANDYLNEFSNEGETCQIADVFTYNIPTPRLFNKDHVDPLVPVFYYCTSPSSSVIVIFDVYNGEFVNQAYVPEIIDLSYIRYNMDQGLIKTNYFIRSGTDVCSDFFGTQELNQESVNLAAKTAETAKPILNPKTAKDISTAIKIGKATTLIGEFNPATFVVSIGCRYNNKDLKQASESLALCNAYLTNIQNGFTKVGYISELSMCVNTAKSQLKTYMDSTLSQIRDVANTLYAPVKALIIRPLSDALQGKTPDLNVKMEETEMSMAKRIYSELSNDMTNIHHPSNSLIIQNQKSRLEQKTTSFVIGLTEVQTYRSNIKEIKPSGIKVFVSNIFMTPKYNVSQGVEYYRDAKLQISASQDLFSDYKYNSAITAVAYAKSDLSNAEQIFKRENSVVRKINWQGTIFAVILGIVIFFVIKEIVLRNR